MPIFDNNGKKQNVQDAHVEKYMELYPDATTIMERDGKKYRVKAKDYNTFLGDTLRTAQETPKATDAPMVTAPQTVTAPQVEAEPQQGFLGKAYAQATRPAADVVKAVPQLGADKSAYTFTADELGIAEGNGKVESEPTSVTTATAEVVAPVKTGASAAVPGERAWWQNAAKIMGKEEAKPQMYGPMTKELMEEQRMLAEGRSIPQADIEAALPQANASMLQKMHEGATMQGAFDRAYGAAKGVYYADEAERLTKGLLDEYSAERAKRLSQVEKDVENYNSARRWAVSNPYATDAYSEVAYRSNATNLRNADELGMMEEFAKDAKKRLLADENLKAKAEENAELLGMPVERYINEVAVPIMQERMYSEWLAPQEERAKRNYNGFAAAAEGSLIGTLLGATRTDTEKYLSQVGQEAWRKNASLLGRAAAGAGSMFLDLPVFMGAGSLASVPAKAVGGQVFKQLAKNETKRLVARGVAEGAAQRYANYAVRNGLKNRILLNLSTAPLQSALTFGMFDAGKAALNMSLNGEWDWKELGKSAVGGTLMGGALGATGAVGGGLTHGLTGATKAAAKVAEFGVENAVFTEGGRLIGKLHGQQPENGWLEDYVESGATLLMIKAPNIVKNVSAIKGDKEAGEVFAFNRLEREQLGKYGEDLNAVLESLLPKSGRLYEDKLKINEGTFTEEYRRVMSDPEVPMTTKAKLMGIVEGKMMPAPRVVDAKIEGNRVMTYDPMGRLVEVKEYATEAKANAEYKKVANAAEIESIAVLEDVYMRIKGYEADELTVKEWLAKNPKVTMEKVAEIVAKNSAGEKLTEGEQKILDSLRKARHEGLNDVRFLNDVLAELNDAGVDVKAVMSGIEKPIDERTEAENRAVKAYTDVLYQEIKAKVVEPFRRGEARRAEDIDTTVRLIESDRSVDETANDGMVYTTTVPSGEKIIITGGKVVLDNEGYIDVNQSEGLVAMFPDGQKKPVRPGDLREKVEVSNAEEMKAVKREEIEQEIAAENGWKPIEVGAEYDVVFDGDAFRVKVEGRDENGDVIISGEGASMALPESVVQDAMKQAETLQAESEVAPVVEGQKGENAEKVVEPVDEAAAFEQNIPVDEKGKKMWEQSTPEYIAEYIRVRKPEDVEAQMSVVSGMIEGLEKQKSKMDAMDAMDIDDKIAFWKKVGELIGGAKDVVDPISQLNAKHSSALTAFNSMLENIRRESNEQKAAIRYEGLENMVAELGKQLPEGYMIGVVDGKYTIVEAQPGETTPVVESAPVEEVETPQATNEMQEADLENAEKGQKAVEPVGEADESTLSQASDQVSEKYVDPNELSDLMIPRANELNNGHGMEHPYVVARNKDGKIRNYYVDMDMEVGEHNINGNETYPPLEVLYEEYGEEFLKKHNIDPAVLPAPGKYRLLGYNNLGFYIDFNGGEYFIPGFGAPGQVRQMIEQEDYRGLMADVQKVESAQKAETPGQSGVQQNESGKMYSPEELTEAKEQLGELNATSAPEFAARLFSIKPWKTLEEANAALKELLASYGETLNGQSLAVMPFLDKAQGLIREYNKSQEPGSVEEVLENGDKRITNYNSRGEVATVATERDGKVVSVDSYDEGVLFEHTEYDGNGKAASVTRYDKSGNVIGTQKYVDGKAKKSGEDELDIYLAEIKALQERVKAFAQKSPGPRSFVEAYIANDAELIKRLEKQFNDALQTLVPLDIPAIEATIKGMKDNKSIIKAGSANERKETPDYKAFDHIEKALAKRKKQLEKELTEDDKRRIDIIKRGNRGELKETAQPKQENKPVENEPIKDEAPVTSETTEQPETNEVANAGPVNVETLQLNMSEEDFNALLNSGDKAAISEYLAEMDGLLRIGAGSPLDGRDTIVKEYRGVVEQYGGEENIPAYVVAGFDERIAPYNALQRAVFDRKYALQDKLREIEAKEEQAKEQAEKEAKAEHKKTAFGGFLSGKTDLGASAAEKALSKKYNFDGKVMTVAEFVEDAVGNGNVKLSAIEEPKYKGASRAAWNRMDARQQEADAKRVKESGTKTVYTVNDHDLGKTAYDYAKFLLDKKAEQEKAAAKQKVKDAIEPFAKEKAAEQAPIKIEDVGEKIGGARKDVIRKYADKIKLDGKTFGTMFPKPEIDQLVEAGLPLDRVAAVKAMFDNAKREYERTKKRMGKDKALSASLFYAMYAKNVLNGETDNFDLKYNGWVFTDWGKEYMKANIALYRAVFEKLGAEYGKMDLAKYAITPLDAQHKKMLNLKALNESNARMQALRAKEKGEEPPVYKDGDLINFVGENHARPSDQFETLEEAVNAMVERIGKEVKPSAEALYKPEVYWKTDERGRADYSKTFVGVKVRGFGTVDLMEFKSSNEARQWLDEHGDDFQQMAAAKEVQVRAENKKPLPKYSIEYTLDRVNSQYAVVANFGRGKVHTLRTFDFPEDDARARMSVFKDEVMPFLNSQEAVQAANEYAEELQQKKSAPKNVVVEKNSRERVGVDWRNGQDATTEMFVDVEGKEPSVFGFRALEFGNYVSQKERQQYLNDIYDALMDMSEVLGVSPRALSLGGKLALAVGARGTSGASGHYEPYKNVINITKTKGAGVLAHEWLHALDRYFSNFDENALYPNGVRYATGKEYAENTRQEIKDAFEKIMSAVRGGEYQKRSARLGDYWASDKELAARALQDYMMRKLDERGQKNDFLSNHLAPEDWAGDMNNYPFPLGAEADRIAEAFDNFFDTVEEKTEDGQTVLFQQGMIELDRENPAFERATENVRKKLEATGVKVKVLTKEEAEKALAELGADAERQTSKEIEAKYPNWLEGTTTESGKHSTQVEGTRKTYGKVGTWIEQNLGKNVSILDASSGMGYGTADLRERGFNIEDVEPYQSEERKQNNPATYSSYEDIDKQYDYIISNAVLNVIPDDWRTDVLHNMADKLKVGGKLFINTRKAGEERSIKDKIELDSPREVLVKRNGRIASYQRFFTPQELKEWVENELGEGYSVEIANEKNSGTKGLAAVVVTKNNESPAKGKTSELGQPISNHKGMANAPLANVSAKVGKNTERANRLDAIISSIEDIGEMGPHEFLHEVVNAMLLSDNISTDVSRYAKLGGGVTLRLADHYGNAETFKEHKDQTENYGLVIKLSNQIFKPDNNVDYLEYVYFPDKLTKERQIEIAKGLKAFMETGRYDLLPKPDKVNPSGKFKDVEFLRTSDGTTYGWAVNGEIYLTPEGLNPNTPIHEYTHLWAAALQKSNPKLWNEVVEAMKLSPAWNEVMADENYTDIHGDENRVASEVLSRLSGNEGYRRYMEQAEAEIAAERDFVGKVQKKGILNRIKNAVSRFWNWLKGKLGSKAKAGDGTEAKTEPWDVFVNKTLKDFDEGVNPDAKDSPLDRMFMGKKGADNLDKAEEATTRLDNLNVAREMETAGKDAKAIKLATGWERGADGKWRYETEDAKVNRAAKLYNLETRESYPIARSIEIGRVDDNSTIRLTDLVKDDELFKAYPQMEEYFVSFEKMDADTKGLHDFTNQMIRINKDGIHSLESTLAHEIQHAIQSIEGFAKGSSSEQFRNIDFYDIPSASIHDMYNIRRNADELIENGKYKYLRNAIKNVFNEYRQRGWLSPKTIEAFELNVEGEDWGVDSFVSTTMSYSADELNDYSINEDWRNKDMYMRTAGEVESRNVQERLGMTPEERRNKLAEETEDVRRKDQIFIFDNLGVSASEVAEEDIPVESVQTQPMTFVEKITNSVLEASAKNKENLALRSDALRMFGRDVANVLKLMGKQREYDKSTVDQLVKLAKMYFKDAQLLGGLTPYQVGRVMTRLNNAVGKRDITDDANELVNILVDAHNKELEKMLEKQAKTKAKKVNASGVEVIGKLDKEGQLLLEEYNAGKELDLESIDDKIIDLQNEAAEGKAEEAAARIRGLELAREYREEILKKLDEIKGLEQELKSAEQDAKDGTMDRAAYKEFRRATERAILESKLEMVDAYHGLIHGLGGEISTAGRRAKLFQQQQIDHVKEIQNNANSDLLGHPAEAQGETPNKWNSSVPRLFMSAMPTFQTMLKFFGEKAADGRGYLYERFIPQHTQASHNEYIGKTEAREKMRDKLTEIFGKKTTIENFMDMSRKDGAVLEYQEGGQKKTIDLTRGQVLYLYMINKMADGQMKLSRMGITDADVLKMAKELPEEMVRFADWVQEEFLTELREKYNKVHERMFGAPMAAIESYFPIKINKRSRGEKIEPGMNAEDKPSTVTGSVIKRTKNAVAIDLSADAMQVLLGHIDDMENWAAWAEFRRDVKSLLNYRHFQNQVKGMESLRYGSGEKLWKNFVDVANIAAGSFKPSSTAADRAVRNIAKGVVSSKIAFRYFTAVKQILSTPAFWSEVDFGKMMNAYLHQKEAWDWAMKNLPGFSKRWEGRASGNEILLESDADWKVWQNRAVQWLSKEGMRANAFIDALTVATGAKAVFETKYEMFKKAGYSEERAREKALNRAAEAYNESQQSSESAYLSPLQAEATFVSSVLTAYRNSPFGYNRKMATAIANLKKKIKKGFKQESIEYMTKQLMRDGLNEEQAKEYAKSTYRRSVARDAADVALYGFFLNYVWVLGPSLIYILGGDDDEKKKDLNVEALIDGAMGGLGNLPAGETLTGAIKAIAEGDVSNFKLPQAVAMQDMETIADLMQTDPVRAAGEVLNILVAMRTGVNPQTFTDMFVALADVEDWSDPRELAMLVLRLNNAPNSKLELLEADEAMENYGANIEEITREYAEYQKSKRAPLTGWLYSDESEQKAIERYEKRFKKILDERFESIVENTDEYDMWYENSDPQMKAKLAKLRQKFLEGDKETTMEKLDSIDVTKKVLFGSGYDEVNTVYYELSTAEDEDMAMMIDAKLKELQPMMDEYNKLRGDERKAYREENLEQIQFYNRLNAHKNNVNNLKGAMKKKPEEAQEKMEKIRKIRTKAIDLINNYNE